MQKINGENTRKVPFCIHVPKKKQLHQTTELHVTPFKLKSIVQHTFNE